MSLFYWFCLNVTRIFGKLFYRYRVVNPERLIENGGALLVSNHVSFFDPPCVAIAFRNPIHFLARKTLFKNKLFGGVIRALNSVPVDQERPDMTSLKKIIALLKSGERVLIFPEGERSNDGQLGKSQPGVGLVIAKSKVPVLPLRIYGNYEAYPRGAKWPKLSKITVVVGDPLDFSKEIEEGGKSKALYQSFSDRTMEAIAKLELPNG